MVRELDLDVDLPLGWSVPAGTVRVAAAALHALAIGWEPRKAPSTAALKGAGRRCWLAQTASLYSFGCTWVLVDWYSWSCLVWLVDLGNVGNMMPTRKQSFLAKWLDAIMT